MISSAEQFLQLRTSEIYEEYMRAATEEAPLEVWMEVIARFPEMRKWVAHNKAVPLTILEILAKDPDPMVRSMVAEKRKLSVDLFELLSQDGCELVRMRLIYNKKTPAFIIDKLTHDAVLIVRNAALDRIDKAG